MTLSLKNLTLKSPRVSQLDGTSPAIVSTLYVPSYLPSTVQTLEVEHLTSARNTFARRPIDSYHVAKLVQAIRSCGAKAFLTPIVYIRLTTGEFVIIDGHHRHIAALTMDWATINALEFTGSWADAMTLSVKANLEIKKALNAQEKSNAAWQLVAHYRQGRSGLLMPGRNEYYCGHASCLHEFAAYATFQPLNLVRGEGLRWNIESRLPLECQ